MSHDLHWVPGVRPDPDSERSRSFSELTFPVTAPAKPTHLHDFAAVIENVIVPRLLMSHAQPCEPAATHVISKDTVRGFITLTMRDDPSEAEDFVGHLLAGGVPFQTILLDVMAPAARELGVRWIHDSTSFVEVTLSVARMHRILRKFDGVPEALWSQEGQGRHALLLPTPGENHTFGLRLVQEFLLRESWSVTNHPVETMADLKAIVSSQHYDVVGFSLSGETLIDALISAIKCVRLHSGNRHVKVIVGGHIFVQRPELMTQCGADAFGVDAPSSVAIVNGWARELAAVN